MSKCAIEEFKFHLVEELVCAYNMDEYEASLAVQNSVTNKMLSVNPEFVMHYSIQDTAEEIWKEHQGLLIEV
jgi:hypothetical protein